MADGILLEDGTGVLLLESGDVLVLESDTSLVQDPIGGGIVPFGR